MLRTIPLLALGAVACGLEPADRNVEWSDAPPDTITPPSGDTPGTYSFPPNTRWAEEVWRIDFRNSAVPGVPNSLWSELPNELVFEVDEEDAPTDFDVVVASLVAGSYPAKQDHCVAAAGDVEAWSLMNGTFELDLRGDQIDLGLPFSLERLTIQGVKDPEFNEIQITSVVAVAPALALATAAFGGGRCDDLDEFGLPCAACEDLEGSCVTLDLKGEGAFVEDFSVERLTPTDVQFNQNCETAP